MWTAACIIWPVCCTAISQRADPRAFQKGKVSADIQGFLRHNENGLMNFHDWKDKLTYLPISIFSKPMRQKPRSSPV